MAGRDFGEVAMDRLLQTIVVQRWSHQDATRPILEDEQTLRRWIYCGHDEIEVQDVSNGDDVGTH
jgi:hypothetical protein